MSRIRRLFIAEFLAYQEQVQAFEEVIARTSEDVLSRAAAGSSY